MTTPTTPLAAALLLAAALTAAPSQASTGLVECAFGDRPAFEAAERDLLASSTSAGHPHGLTDGCGLITVGAAVTRDPCPDYAATFNVRWEFVVDSTVRDPVVDGADYPASVTATETWERSNSNCALTAYTCDILVGDGSRFHKDGHALPAWGFTETRTGQYKVLEVSEPHISCVGEIQVWGQILPGLYVYGHAVG